MSPPRAKAGASASGRTSGMARVRELANSFGLLEALLGLVVGFLLSMIAVAAYATATHHPRHPSQFGQDVVGLFALWVGFVGAAVVATRMRVATTGSSAGRSAPGDAPTGSSAGRSAPGDAPEGSSAARGSGSVVRDYGFSLRPWPDIPLGIVVGVASQYLLVPLLELPLLPFVHHLFERLGHPAQSLTGHTFGAGLVLVSVLVCVGSPVVEELFFRGLVLRAMLGYFAELGPRMAPAISVVITGLVFALVHFQALQFLGLAGFGVVLGYLAWRTGRLGPSIVAHMAFNTVTIIAIVVSR